MSRLWLLGGAFILVGCAATPPLEAVRAFSNASNAFDAASQPLLDQVANAERASVRKLIEDPPEDTKNVLPVPLPGGGERRLLLDLPTDQVRGLATVGDPPATAAYRKGVAAIKHYAAVLVLLAEGENIDAARAELGLLAANIAGVAALGPTGNVAQVVVVPALDALKPLIDGAANAQNTAELRRLVVEFAPLIKELNAKLRSGAEPMFHMLLARDREIIVVGDGDPVAALARIDGYRVALANWLVLLDLIDQATDQLVAAVTAPRNTAVLANLAELSARISTYAEGARRALAVIRAGSQP